MLEPAEIRAFSAIRPRLSISIQEFTSAAGTTSLEKKIPESGKFTKIENDWLTVTERAQNESISIRQKTEYELYLLIGASLKLIKIRPRNNVTDFSL